MSEYVGAPYNFVPLGEKIYQKEDIVKHSEITGLSGVIEYQITAQTPIIVDDGNGAFYKNRHKKATIPGSTMRGLVRNNMQILSQSSIAEDIQNANLMYRCVGGSGTNPNKKSYNSILGADTIKNQSGEGSISVLKNVRGGYITKNRGKYQIIPTVSVNMSDADMNYYILSERYIIEKEFDGFELLKTSPGILQNQNNTCFTKEKDKYGRIKYRGQKNNNYKPYYKIVYYRLGDNRKISALAERKEDGYKQGVLISSGFMNDKKAFYVIPMADEDEEKWIDIDTSDIDSFRRDFEGRKNQLTVATGFNLKNMNESEKTDLKEDVCRFFGLPEEGEKKPVFYIYIGDRLYFGFTPRLRIFYDNDIFHGLPEAHQVRTFDYCKSLFGFAPNPSVKSHKSASFMDASSYRSRLSFQDAIVDNQNAREGSKKSMVLGEPKPTSYLDYLTSDSGKPVTYNDNNFRLRGIKQYWLHHKTVQANASNNVNVGSSFVPYPDNTSFTGWIRFTNLDEKELGMLLWSLLLEKDSQQNMGKAKSYGYGRVKISLKNLNILNPSMLYQSDNLCLEPYENQTSKSDEYIAIAKEDIEKFIGTDIMSYPPIRDFLWMKNELPDEEKIRYMSLGGGKDSNGKKIPSDYQQRQSKQIPLDNVGVVLGKQARKEMPNPNIQNKNEKNISANYLNEDRGSKSTSVGTNIGDILKNIKINK